MTDKTKPKIINFIIDSTIKNITLASTAIRGICRHLSLSEIDSYYLELCVIEAITNAIKHAYSGEEGHPIELNISYTANEITLRISDTGKPMSLYIPGFIEFDPDDIASIPDNGRGLYIIKSIMDEVSYDSAPNQNTLTMKKTFYKS